MGCLRFLLLSFFTFFFSVLSAASIAAESTRLLDKSGYLNFAPISEMSGIIKSQQYEDVYWVHNDSGDKPRLFAINSQGKVIVPPFLQRSYQSEPAAEEGEDKKPEWPGSYIHAASNIDWEDITTDGDMLYVADMGNNGNARRDLGVYVIPEPNPTSTQDIRALKFLPIRYSGQQQYPAQRWHYDNESIFYSDGHLYFISKHRQPGKISGWEKGAVLYRLDTEFTDRYNVLTEVQHSDSILLATGADISPDGLHLAIICYTEVWVFEKPAEGDHWFSGSAQRLALDRAQMKTSEAITWIDNETLLLGNEERDLFTLAISDIPAVEQ
ncbi:MAG: hypothetical protein ACJAVI_001707 [Candidatus Azotimanducaceae bacterium]|jgi:hypothetical protein